MSLADKTVLITGATSGIGRACAEAARDAGAQVIAVGRDLTKIEAAGFAQVIAADLATDDGIASLLAQLKTSGATVHGWVLAAGTQEIRPLMMESADSLARAWRTNVAGVLGLMAGALKARLVHKGGSIVLLSSAATHASGPGMVGYVANKGALEAAAKSMALELAGQRIRVNAVAPGMVRTPMSDRYMSKMTEPQRAALEAAHPLGFGTPADIAGPVLFLLDDASRWITGTTMLVDGGLCAH